MILKMPDETSGIFSTRKKSMTFFSLKKYATFFVKLTLYEKSRYARQKVLRTFLTAMIQLEAGLAPSNSPAAY